MAKAIRKIRVEGNTAYIPLTRGEEAIIDAEDVPLVEGVNWAVYGRKGKFYACRQTFRDKKKVGIIMHRLIAKAPDHALVDHIDGNSLNNRKSNLRLATPAENTRNRKFNGGNSSGFKGVTWHKKYCKWQASIKADGINHFLGMFDDPSVAHKAYCAASAKYHGEFGRTG